MKLDPSVRSLLLDVMRRFPASKQAMLSVARYNRSVEFSNTDMLGRFARETQLAVESGNTELAKEHLQFMSGKLERADGKQYEYIDVYYVEGLLSGLSDADAGSLWNLMPENLRALHVAMWGTSRLPRPDSAA